MSLGGGTKPSVPSSHFILSMDQPAALRPATVSVCMSSLGRLELSATTWKERALEAALGAQAQSLWFGRFADRSSQPIDRLFGKREGIATTAA